MTDQQTHSVDILIVGAGPTGLTLANILGQAGIRTLIIDRKPSTVAEPRAVSIDDESLRTMQFIGLDQPVLKDVVLGYGVHYFTRPGGHCFGKVEPTRSEYGFPRRNAFRQPLFEATLREGAQRFAALDMRFGHELEERAKATFHSTAVQAAEVAASAGAEKLIIGHFSSRYTDAEVLAEEARTIFPDTQKATEGMVVVVA